MSEQVAKKQRLSAVGTTLVWFRTDLRVTDNLALFKAAKNGNVIGVYIISPMDYLRHDIAPIKIDFWLRNLKLLQIELQKLGIPLIIHTAPHWNQIAHIVLDIAAKVGAKNLYYNIEYECHELKRDMNVSALLQEHGVSAISVHDQCIIQPGFVKTDKEKVYEVFTPFKKQWIKVIYKNLKELLSKKPVKPLQEFSESVNSFFIQHSSIPSSIPGFELSKEKSEYASESYAAGEGVALTKLTDFVSKQITNYKDARDFPVLDGTSKLSPYLSSGIISARVCLITAMKANADCLDSGNIGIQTWVSELCWRDFYKHILVAYPRVCKSKAFKVDTDNLKWETNEDYLQKWKDGQTGYPIVDAAMRQLNATGWMHNRLRMITAGFLAKDLLLDWRLGEAYFMQNLIDGDFSANNGGWQWAASTGTDSVPYFRVFNPQLQSERFDATGQFIRNWVPELKNIKGKAIHSPYSALSSSEFSKLQYPRPMVDHKEARDKFLGAYKKAIGKE